MSRVEGVFCVWLRDIIRSLGCDYQSLELGFKYECQKAAGLLRYCNRVCSNRHTTVAYLRRCWICYILVIAIEKDVIQIGFISDFPRRLLAIGFKTVMI